MNPVWDGRFISADGHVVEPKDLWTRRVDKQFRDRAPRIDSRGDGDWYLIDGLPPFPSGVEGPTLEQKIKGKVEKGAGYRHEETRPGAWDPVERLKDQQLDNVRAEIIYPGFIGLNLFQVPDLGYQRECVRVYNDWMHEFNSTAPDRLFGAALLPGKGPVEWIIEEAGRVAKTGFRIVMMPIDVPERPYVKYTATYAPLWECLEELDLRVVFHVATSTDSRNLALAGNLLDRAAKSIIVPGIISELIAGGIPQNHPRLKLALVETGGGWQASVLCLLDHMWQDHKHWVEPRLEESPSFYFKRNFWVTFQDDRAAILTRHLINVDHLMWGSDFPHTEGTFPNSREHIAKDMGDIPEEERQKIVFENAARFLDLVDETRKA